MKYALQVNASPYAAHTGYAAYRFALAALQAGHQILRIFFYQDGIYHACRHALPPGDELNIAREWSTLAISHGVDLVVCISAAQRRGLLCDDEASRHGVAEGVFLADGFRIGGLGQWLEASLLADRCITFA